MIVLGLTGSIGMGKSTTAAMLRAMDIPVFDADQYVHRALNKGGRAVKFVRALFPDVYDRRGQKINREKLGDIVFADGSARLALNSTIHPLVRAAEKRFIGYHARRGTKIIVLDIPLLFETGAEGLCDVVMVVTAPASVQRARVLARPGWNLDKFKRVKAAQMSDAQKRARADVILNTGGTLAQTQRDLLRILKSLQR